MHRLFFIILLVVSWANASEIRAGGGTVALHYWCVHPQQGRAGLNPVFLLHGLGADSQDWAGIYEVIALQTNRTVCMPDARSHGLSPQTEEFTLWLNAADTIRLLDQLNVSRAILVGHSMGGKTASINALYHPERVEKLVVEDQRPNSINPDVRFQLKTKAEALKNALALVPDDATKEEATDIVFRSLKDAIKKAFGEDWPDSERATWRDRLECVHGRWRYTPDVDRLIRISTDPDAEDGSLKGRFEGESLFIYGKLSESKVGDVADEIREQFPKALLVGVEGVGHNVHHEKPREFLAAVIALINN